MVSEDGKKWYGAPYPPTLLQPMVPDGQALLGIFVNDA